MLTNMIDCEIAVIETPTGPGGVSGPLRIDFQVRSHMHFGHAAIGRILPALRLDLWD